MVYTNAILGETYQKSQLIQWHASQTRGIEVNTGSIP